MKCIALVVFALCAALSTALQVRRTPAGLRTRLPPLFISDAEKNPFTSVNFEIGDVKERFTDVFQGAQKNLQEGEIGDRGEGWALGQVFLIACIAVGGLPVVGGLVLAVTGPGLFLGGLSLIVWACLELGPNLTPFPKPVDTNTLKTTGPYALMRHPTYTGLIAVAFGLGVITGSVERLLLAGAIAVFLDQKASKEEELLAEKHVAYNPYKEEVAKFIPRLP